MGQTLCLFVRAFLPMPIHNYTESAYIHVFINRYICTSLCIPIDRQRERERYCVCVLM